MHSNYRQTRGSERKLKIDNQNCAVCNLNLLSQWCINTKVFFMLTNVSEGIFAYTTGIKTII